jgi:CPA2 family monovalent cation:H+ antiporter-2
MHAHDFLRALATTLCVAAVTTVLFQRLRQPVVLGYILAGLVVGPHLPIPLVADPEIVRTLSELGVILLMFALGLELRLGQLARVGSTAGTIAVVQCSVMMWLGYLVARAFGWTVTESLFTAAAVAISSTTIVAKAFEEQGIRGRMRELVIGELVIEDVLAILLMAALTSIAGGGILDAATGEPRFPADALLRSTVRFFSFLIGLLCVGILVVPRIVRAVTRLGRAETTLVASIGICFAVALITLRFGYSVALGAFIAGTLVAESGREAEIQPLVRPVRDVFAAIFFVSVGMMLDPHLIATHWKAGLALTAVVIGGKVLGVTAGALLAGSTMQTAVAAGMSLAQIGEFSFIIAELGRALGATGDFLYPVIVTVSAATTMTTPWLIRASRPAAAFVDRKLPRRLQMFSALYASWLERARAAFRDHDRDLGARARRLVVLLLLDAALLLGLVIAVALGADNVARFASDRLAVSLAVARAATVAAGCFLAAPFCVGIIRIAARLAQILSAGAFPLVPAGKVDLSAAPRRGLALALQTAIVIVVSLPLVAVTQPFLSSVQGAAVLAFVIALSGLGLWRRAQDVQGHVRAGAEVVVSLLASRGRAGAGTPREAGRAPAAGEPPMPAHELFAGLGAPVPVTLDEGSPAVGRTLAMLNLRGLTGATVLAIVRGDRSTPDSVVPAASEVLRAGDVLALAGSDAAVDQARALLTGDAASSGANPPGASPG